MQTGLIFGTIGITLAVQLLTSAISSLPPDKFEFYPWFRHTLLQWLNAVPQQYRAPATSGSATSAPQKEP